MQKSTLSVTNFQTTMPNAKRSNIQTHGLT